MKQERRIYDLGTKSKWDGKDKEPGASGRFFLQPRFLCGSNQY